MKLTIITVNRNNSEGLRRTIQSVLSQTYSNFEYIIVDGASSDSSLSVINELIEKKSNLNCSCHWISEKDKGIYDGMNKGILMSHGEYLQFLNSGDYFYNPYVLENIFGQDIDEDVVFGDRVNVWYENGEEKTELKPQPDKITGYFLWRNMVSHQASFIRRDLFDKFGLYDDSLRYASDWKFYLILFLRNTCSYRHLSMPVVYFDRTGISSDPNNWHRMQAERKRVFDSLLPALGDDYERLLTLEDKLYRVDRRAEQIGKLMLYIPRKIWKFVKNI